MGRYVSLEAKIAGNKDLYYDALSRAQEGWHEGTEDALPFIKYLLGTFLAAYKDFEDRFSIVEEKMPAVDIVRKAAINRIGKFTKQDINLEFHLQKTLQKYLHCPLHCDKLEVL